MIGRRAYLAAALATAASSLLAAPAWADDVEETLRAITKARSKTRTLRARFTQTRTIGLLATEVKSNGSLSMVQPGRLRWQLDPPDAVTYWIGPKGLAIDSGDGVTRIGRAGAGRFAAVLDDLMTMLGGDLGKLRRRYRLELSREGGKIELSATPKNKKTAKHVRKLSMRASLPLWNVERVVIHERNGDASRIDFEPFERNVAIPAAHMRPPAKR
jgi:outer membrane lipoprotein-sorting protein